jgi:hypothetical protein
MADPRDKAFDAVRLMRELRDAQDGVLEPMTSVERIEYIRARAERTWREMKSRPAGEQARKSAR